MIVNIENQGVVGIRMKKFLNNIRSAENPIPLNKQIINTVCILFIELFWELFQSF